MFHAPFGVYGFFEANHGDLLPPIHAVGGFRLSAAHSLQLGQGL